MGIKISDLWRWEGTIDRGPYLIMGAILFLVKHNLDRFIASYYFNKPWSLFNYIIPSEAVQITKLPSEEKIFYATLLAVALPFIFSGVMLTIKRLRATKLSPWLVILFFIPFVKLAFFLLMSFLPSQEEGKKAIFGTTPIKRAFDRIIPDHWFGSAAMGMVITVPLSAILAVFCISILGNYGWTLFVGMPFCLGLTAVLFHGYHKEKSFLSCLLVSTVPAILLGILIIGIAVEGVICIIMAAPIAFFLSWLGGIVGYFMQKRPASFKQSPAITMLLLLFLPVLMGAEYQSAPTTPLIEVQTAIEIAAPPETVWHNVVSFSELPTPDSWLFHTGVAYPMRAEITGQGVGAIRRCVFSTGAFVEPIEVWDEPKLLKFSVTAQPPAMQEWTLYPGPRPPHLDNYLVSHGGQFKLTTLPNGHTLLEGTTWYDHKIWPVTYWQVWSDAIIHRIHLRVLKHIKQLSEHPATSK